MVHQVACSACAKKKSMLHRVYVACPCCHTIEVCRKELTEEAAKKAAEAAEPDKKGKDKDKKKK